MRVLENKLIVLDYYINRLNRKDLEKETALKDSKS